MSWQLPRHPVHLTISRTSSIRLATANFYRCSEENAYMLCKKLCRSQTSDQAGYDLFVIFISNEQRQVPLWCQKASKTIDQLVVWDYHVICVQKLRGQSTQVLVWDLDTTLPFPVPLNKYVAEAIQPSLSLPPEFRRFFRVVYAPIYLQTFASDRRHMRESDGSWKAPPPAYDCIVADDGSVHNLEMFISMSGGQYPRVEEEIQDVYHKKFGIVIDEIGLENFFKML